MPLWRIYPVADPGVPHWQGRKIWEEVIVRAKTAALARVIASRLDEPPVPYRIGNETLCFRSGFEDVKLYWVQELSAHSAARYEDSDAQEGVISAIPKAHSHAASG